MKSTPFFMIFNGFSAARNCLRRKSEPSNNFINQRIQTIDLGL